MRGAVVGVGAGAIIPEALSGPAGAAAVSLYFTCLLVLVLFGLHRLWLMLVVSRTGVTSAIRPAIAAPTPGGADENLPLVTVQCPLYDEAEVAARLIDAVCSLDYPRDRLEVQILDDSGDEAAALSQEAAARWRERGVDISVLRRGSRAGFKAGALAQGLASSRGDLLAIFDADFVPHPSFLRRVVPSFSDPAVGMVQARWGHLNRERSWLTQVQALLLDGHFFIEHAARFRSGRFFNFNGTAGIFRRRCIEDAGGWQHDTLTEDLDLSYRAQLAGWKFAYLEEVEAPAELPSDVLAWKGQQRRWTTGAVQTARKLLPRIMAAPLSARVKLEALAHLTSNAAHPMLLLLCLTTLPAAAARRAWGWGPMTAVEVPILLLTTGVVWAFFLLAARRDGGEMAWHLIPRLLAVGVGACLSNTRAVAAGLRSRVGEFVRTPKTGDEGGETDAPEGRRSCRSWPGGHRAIDPWAVIELGLGLSLAVESGVAAAWALWPTVPFLGLFSAGFLAIGLGSLRSSWRARAVSPAA